MPKTHNQFKLDDYDVIGFDLDGTLLRYNIGEMIPLEYQILTKFLVERRNYAPELLKKKFNMDFLQKGLVLDADHGNVLKLNKDAVIIRATHGTRFLSDEEVIATYGESREWQVATQFYKDPLSTWNGPLSEKIRSLLDYFDMSVSLVFAQVVDTMDKENGGRPKADYRQVWADILDGLLCMYTRENFSNGQSPYFNALKAEPSRYLLKTNPKVIQWLKQLRAAGKSTFLLTGSYVDFANFTATYALGPDWRQLFDVVICFARKPGFFVQQRPFLPTQNNAELSDSPLDLKATVQLNGSTYTQGSWHQLLATFAKQLKTPANNISALYVGDNLLQDIYSPVKHHDLNAVAICEEMFERSLEFPYQNVVKSEAWGSYFDVNEDCTMWAAIIKEYAEICVPTVDALLDQPLDGVFICDENKFYRTKTT